MRSVIIAIVLGAALVNASDPFSMLGSGARMLTDKVGSGARMLTDKVTGCPNENEVKDLETKMKKAVSADCKAELDKDAESEDGKDKCMTGFEKCDLTMDMEYDMPCDKTMKFASGNSTNSTSGNGSRRLGSHGGTVICDHKQDGKTYAEKFKAGVDDISKGKKHMACIPKQCANVADLTESGKVGKEGLKMAVCMGVKSDLAKDGGKAYSFKMKGAKVAMECPGGIKASATDAGFTGGAGGNGTKKGSTSNAYSSTAMALPGVLLIAKSIMNF